MNDSTISVDGEGPATESTGASATGASTDRLRVHVATPLKRVARLHACCSRWSTLIRRWDTLTDRGLAIANELVNARLSRRYATPSALGSLALFADATASLEAHNFNTTRRLYPQLVQVCADLKTALDQMVAVNASLQGLADGSELIVCLGVSVKRFATASDTLAGLYAQEFAVREAICADVLSPGHDRRSHLLSLTAWMTEPYVDNQSHIKRLVQEVAAAGAADGP